MPRAGVLFSGQLSKPVNVHFDTEAMTSDGGVVLVGALIPLLRRLVYKLKRLFKKARVRVRADSGFGKSPRLLATLDALPVEYVLAYQTLKARVKESLRRFVLHCPVDFPWAREWYEAALAVGAVPS